MNIDYLKQEDLISKSLFALQNSDCLEKSISEVLLDTVSYFKVERAYLFRFNIDAEVFECVGEERFSPEIISVCESPPIDYKLWSSLCADSLMKGTPILVHDVEQLSNESLPLKRVFEKQHVSSAMLVPIFSKGLWGYAGIDTGKRRVWTSEECLCFSTLVRLIANQTDLYFSKPEIEKEREYQFNVFRSMPIAYLLIKPIYTNERAADATMTKRLVDFTIVDSNKETVKFLSLKQSPIGQRGSDVYGSDFESLLTRLVVAVNVTDAPEFIYYSKESEKYHKVMPFLIPPRNEIVLLMTDIAPNYSDRRRTEKHESLLSELYDKFPIGIELYDANGILVDINDRVVEMFGGSCKEDILGINIFEHPVLLPEIKEKMILQEPINFTSSFDCARIPSDYYKKSRFDTFDLTTKISYLYDEKGELKYYVFLNTDNTETVNAYKKVQEIQSYFSMISEYAKVGFYRWNPITFEGMALDQWYENLGKPVASRFGDIKDHLTNLHPDDVAEIMQFHRNVLLGKEDHFKKELQVVDAKGNVRWIRSYEMVKVYNPAGKHIEIVGMNFDITELKDVEKELIESKEKAEAADSLKSAFLANMSHEIRTPLNAIVGFSGILAEIEDEKEREMYVDLVTKNSDLLLNLINDILDLSRIEIGKYEFSFENVEISALCRQAVESIKVRANNPNVTIFCTDNLPLFTVRTDKNRLLQVINNLLSNAVKFTNEGCVELGCEILEDTVLFEVKDTGIGIEEDKLLKVFDRFEKLNSFAQGTGLGLAICRQVVEKLGGEIGVESVYGSGSRFWFTISKQSPEVGTDLANNE